MNARKMCTAAFAVLFLAYSAAHAEQYAIPLFPAPGTSGDPQGVLRIVNDTGKATTVQVFAVADDGMRSSPATVALGATAAVEFDATELRSANVAKGLSGGLGSISGDVRLTIDSDAPIVPLAFVRASDGTLSAMHDTVRGVEAGDDSGGYTYEVPIFNLSTEMAQASRLRLVNPGDGLAAVTIAGRDDTGAATARGDVALTLAAGGARTLTAQQLEAGGAGLTGRLGAGLGRWRLTVSSDRPLQVVNVVESPAGHWNNLSTTAARGAAPADRAGFDDRFVGETAVLEAAGGRFTLMFMDNGRFSETVQADGMAVTSEGGYDYAGLGPDAGRLTLDYDDGRSCQANWYFSSRAGGWFASRCSGGPDPDVTRSGGIWFVGDEEDDGGGADSVEATYGVGATLPGVPMSGLFVPARLDPGSGSARSSGGSTTVDLNDGGHFELSDGTRYTCASAGGCEIVDGTVTRGSVTGRAASSEEVDRFPSFRNATAPGDRTYTVGTAIDPLTLPQATGGNGALTYGLSPNVPGLTFNAAARQLSGTPSTAASYNMAYTVTDEDGDTDTLRFSITVSADTPADGSLGVCRVGMTLGSGQSCAYPGTADEFSVNARGRGSFLGRLAGIRIRINNETINDRVYDFEASHQGEGIWRIDRVESSNVPATAGGMADSFKVPVNSRGIAYANDRFFVFRWGDGKIYAYTAMGQRDPDNDFDLAHDVGLLDRLAYANGRFYVFHVHGNGGKLFAYTVTGQRDASNDFVLDDDNVWPRGIASADGRNYVVNIRGRKVYAYTPSGTREPAADFDLDDGNDSPSGIVHAASRFYVVDSQAAKVFAYTGSGARDAGADFELACDNGDAIGIAY
ncbi:MAG: Ig domain-containing protein, partial [Rhodospirillaceae bacterium]|nr:Ig domain-containing protein [Rhodospirillaceae bacterium]